MVEHGDFYDRVFRRGARFGDQVVSVRSAGELFLESGRLCVLDPGYLDGLRPDQARRPFQRRAPVGRFPVQLAVAKERGHGLGLIACVLVRFAQVKATRWTPATRAGERLSDLVEDRFFGFGIDSGVACVADARALEAWLPERRAPGCSSLEEALEPHVHRRRSVGRTKNLVLDPTTGANAVAFEPGMGDGFYRSFWGLDRGGKVVAFVVDLLVLPAPAASRRPRAGNPWHVFSAAEGLTALRADGPWIVTHVLGGGSSQLSAASPAAALKAVAAEARSHRREERLVQATGSEIDDRLAELATRRFERAHGRSTRFWEIFVAGQSHTVRWGIVGAAGKTKKRWFPSVAVAASDAERLVAEQITAGYTPTSG